MEDEVQLTNGSVLLRPYRPTDAEAVYEAVRESLAELMVWLPWAHRDYAIEETRAWIESCAEKWAQGTEYNFAILDARDGSFLGGCGLNQVNRAEGFGNLGYWVRTSRTRQGIATAAARLAVQFGFGQLGLKRIEVGAATGNVASQRVAEKLGARRDGIQNGQITFRDKVYDRVVFSLTPDDTETRA